MLDFNDRVAVVTGAGRGIGRAHALMLAERGARVVVNDLGGEMDGTGSDPGPAADTVAEIESRLGPGRALANPEDVTTTEGAGSIVADAIESFGRLDVVINNAGIVTSHEFPASGLPDLDAELGVHLIGSYNVTAAAWPHLVDGGYGRVVMTTSCAIFGSPVLASYGAAKGALIGLARNLAADGAEHGIKVNLVAPYARTRMADPDAEFNADARKDVTESEPADDVFARLAPADIAAAVGFLAHEGCDLTGEILSAGGGRVARIFIAETEGIGVSGITPEDVAARWPEISSDAEYFIPPDITEYTNYFTERVPPAA